MKDRIQLALAIILLLIAFMAVPVYNFWRIRQFQKVSGFGFWKAAFVLK